LSGRSAGATRARPRGAARNGFISFISGVSMLGIALGVAALIIVLSVMNGFQKEVRDRMLSVIAHVEVFDAQGGRWPTGRPPRPRRGAPAGDRRGALRRRAGAARRAATRCAARCAASTRRSKARSPDWRALRGTALAQLQPGRVASCSAASWRAAGRAVGDKVTLVRPGGRSRRPAWCRG
jgi:lipoprotein-releasing system permease protein